MGYLTTKYKGKYRLKCEVDKVTNDFPKTLKGTYEDADVYIIAALVIKYFIMAKEYYNRIFHLFNEAEILFANYMQRILIRKTYLF